MIEELITRAVELKAPSIPSDWDECTLIRFENSTIGLMFKNGTVEVVPGDNLQAKSIINLSCLRFCNAVDGTTDFMTVWREFAEPSPTDRSTIEKGTGAKITNILTHLISCYNEDADFRTLVDEYKRSLV
jgi:hypothetical protein